MGARPQGVPRAPVGHPSTLGGVTSPGKRTQAALWQGARRIRPRMEAGGEECRSPLTQGRNVSVSAPPRGIESGWLI
jgi:hypothetical protein